MKLSNFQFIEKVKIGKYSSISYATIDVETGWLYWKKKKTVSIASTWKWYFVDTGEYIDSCLIEPLIRIYEATYKKKCDE